MVAAMLCLMIPTVGSAQGLPDFLQAVQSGLSEGLSAGSAAMEKDLALSMTLSDSRVEEGRDVTLTIRAENPRPAETGVSLTLNLPERLAAQTGDELTWNAVLPAAQVDETGAFVPSVTTFTRVLTLMPGGESAQGTVTAEMNVGSRFYRESLPIALCVADISTRASVSGAQNGRATVGETLTYTVEIANAGMAEKSVPVELILPADAALEGELPEGFAQVQRQIRGEVGIPAAGSEPSVVTLTFPMTIREDALAEDEDALRLLSGVLRVDGQRIALPRVQLCGPKISAKLLPQTDNLKTQLSKLGNTPFEAKEIEISFTGNWFLPASVLADFRRQAIDQLITARRINYRQELAVWKSTSHAFPQTTLTYLGNVMNTRAASFYQEHGVQQVAAAYEKEAVEDAVLMFCKHCLRYSMGWCPIHQRVRSPYKEPYYLVSNDGKRFRLEFDCKNCQMKVKAAQ